MDTPKPLVSIVIITMNHEKFIEQSCLSAISQTYPNIEIVFLDNKSDDATFSIAKKIFEESSIAHILIENKERFGVAKNLNILLENVSGEYVCILSGDDWLSENSIEEKISYFLTHPEVDFAISDGYRFLENEQKIVDAYSEKQKAKIIRSIPHFFHENVTQNLPFNVGVFIKTKLLKDHPFDEQIHAEDWDMNLRLTSLGYKIGFIDQKLFYYRILNNSLSSNWTLMESSYIKITDKYRDYILAHTSLTKKYKINLLKHHFQKKLSETLDEAEKKSLSKEWKREKNKVKYRQPILFFKQLFS